MKYLWALLFCTSIYADSAFLASVSSRVEDLREATGSLSCPTYKQNCLTDSDTGPYALICDGSDCATFVLSVFSGQGNCNQAARCTYATGSSFWAGCNDCSSSSPGGLSACYTAVAAVANNPGFANSCTTSGGSPGDWACACTESGDGDCSAAPSGTDCTVPI